MSLANYSDLKSSVTNWLVRSDLAGSAADFITLAEAGLNRELNPVETDATLTGTSGSRTIDISSQSVVEPISLFLAETGLDEIELTRKDAGTFPVLQTDGRPEFWSVDGTNIRFNRQLDADYPFRFRFRQRFSLSDASPTNWLLTNHPDLYLAATLVWGGIFKKGDQEAARWATVLSTSLASVRSIIAQSNRGTLTVDPALASIGRRPYYNWKVDL